MERHTVSTTPAMTTMKLNDCCVVRAAFSRPERSPHCMRPSSLATVMALRVGCVAYFRDEVWALILRTRRGTWLRLLGREERSISLLVDNIVGASSGPWTQAHALPSGP